MNKRQKVVVSCFLLTGLFFGLYLGSTAFFYPYEETRGLAPAQLKYVNFYDPVGTPLTNLFFMLFYALMISTVLSFIFYDPEKIIEENREIHND